MNEKEKPVYVGSGKLMSNTWIKATIKPEALEEFIEEFKGSKFVKLNINIKDQVDKYGKNVSISIDTYKPELSSPEVPSVSKIEEAEEDDLPF